MPNRDNSDVVSGSDIVQDKQNPKCWIPTLAPPPYFTRTYTCNMIIMTKMSSD